MTYTGIKEYLEEGITNNQQALLYFAIRHPGWHSVSEYNIKTMKLLEKQDLIEVKYENDKSPKFRLNMTKKAHDMLSRIEKEEENWKF